MSASSPCAGLASTLHFVQYEMRSLTFRRLKSGTDFTHVIVRRRTAMTRMRLDAIPFYDEYDPAGVFKTGKKFDSVRAGKIGVFECLPEFLDIFIAFCWINGLNHDLMNHVDILHRK
jgi:hypothetical protein